jgi:hypothetical protein
MSRYPVSGLVSKTNTVCWRRIASSPPVRGPPWRTRLFSGKSHNKSHRTAPDPPRSSRSKQAACLNADSTPRRSSAVELSSSRHFRSSISCELSTRVVQHCLFIHFDKVDCMLGTGKRVRALGMGTGFREVHLVGALTTDCEGKKWPFRFVAGERYALTVRQELCTPLRLTLCVHFPSLF